MNIEGKHVLLRAIEPSDLPLLQRWANDPAIQRMLGGWHFPTSMADQEVWFSSLSCNSLNQRFAIEAPGLGLIGTAFARLAVHQPPDQSIDNADQSKNDEQRTPAIGSGNPR